MRLAIPLLSILAPIESWADDLDDVPCDSSPLAEVYCGCLVELDATQTERDGCADVVVERERENRGLKLTISEQHAARVALEAQAAADREQHRKEVKAAVVLTGAGALLIGAIAGYATRGLLGGRR